MALRMFKQLRGKRVLLTGASRGIGVHIAERLAREGVELVLVARDEQKLGAVAESCRNLGAKVEVLAADVSRAEDRARLLNEAGEIDILINNAGVESSRSLVEQTESDVRAQLEINLVAPIELSRGLVPGMIARGRGVIVNVSSMSGKSATLLGDAVRIVGQAEQLRNPDGRLAFEETRAMVGLLNELTECYQGARTGDRDRFVVPFWEVANFADTWEPYRNTSTSENPCDGISEAIRWERGVGSLHKYAQETRQKLHDMHESGQRAWGRLGVAINQMRSLRAYLYFGEKFDGNVNVVFPKDASHLAAVWAFCSSSEYEKQVRRIDQKLAVTNATLVKVPFDLTHWQQIAAEKYPTGLPKPNSNDPTQWLFNGHPRSADAPLQVAVARLVGYRWPRQTGSSFQDCPALGPDGLEKHADDDGIVALNSVKGERPASARLLALLADAFGSEWSAARLNALLAEVGCAGKALDDWLCDAFFEQHCDLFHQRPFVWHIWDGRRDGFHALVNYHRLAAPNGEGRRTLERLLYSYLGDWVKRQRDDQKAGEEGADARVAAALHLKTELERILEGEPPYDIFVRWKPLHEQPIGWEPDINDGVRINIRPFMTAKPLGARAKGACILRTTPKIKWDKDRGKEPQRPREHYPWLWGWDPDNKDDRQDFAGRGNEPDGNRWNDLHYTRTFKEAARSRLQGAIR